MWPTLSSRYFGESKIKVQDDENFSGWFKYEISRRFTQPVDLRMHIERKKELLILLQKVSLIIISFIIHLQIHKCQTLSSQCRVLRVCVCPLKYTARDNQGGLIL